MLCPICDQEIELEGLDIRITQIPDMDSVGLEKTKRAKIHKHCDSQLDVADEALFEKIMTSGSL